MKRNVWGLVALLLLVLALAACGGNRPTNTGDAGDDADTTPAEATPMAEETPMMEETPMAEETPEGDAGGETGTMGTPENPIVMSFVPSGETTEILASGEEIAAMLSEMTGLTVEANVATSYAAVVEALGAGQAQVGWLNTFSYVLASERYDVDVSLATVRRGNPYYTGQIIANADAGIAELADIEGKTMCWVDPLSTSGYIIPRIMLAAAGVDVDNLEAQELGSHDNVALGVYNGDCDAGATFVDARTAIAEEFPDVNERVIVIAESPEIPNDTVAFSPDVPDDVRQQLVDGLLEIAGTEEGVAALESVYEIEGFEEVDDSFYDEFRTELDASGIDIEELAGDN